MKKYLFEDWHQWKVCLLSGCRKSLWGLWRMFTCIIFGIISLFFFCFRQVEAFCRREKIAAVIIAVILGAVAFGWYATFVNERAKVKIAEYQRDSVSIKLANYLQSYASDATIVINGDTIK